MPSFGKKIPSELSFIFGLETNYIDVFFLISYGSYLGYRNTIHSKNENEHRLPNLMSWEMKTDSPHN